MKLYTITATPEVHAGQAREFPSYKGDLARFNHENHLHYRGVVSGILATFGIEGFTIYAVQGYWGGMSEDSYKIEIALDDESTIRTICERLRDVYHQDAVMLTLPDNTVEFI